MSVAWIFAYGSLVFRPDFPYLERRRAFVAGYARRFWQGSPDHRGVPNAPGRVATLIEDPTTACGGCAYRIAPEDSTRVLEMLDERERAGFDRRTLPLLDDALGRPFAEGLVYVARPGNAHDLGPASEEEIARWVRRAHGPSGSNEDYVRRLQASLGELEIADPHVDAIARWLTTLP